MWNRLAAFAHVLNVHFQSLLYQRERFRFRVPCGHAAGKIRRVGMSDLKAAFPEVKQWIVYYTEPYMGSNQKHAEDSQEAIEMLRTDGFHVLVFNAAIEMSRQGKASP